MVQSYTINIQKTAYSFGHPSRKKKAAGNYQEGH